MVGRGKAKGKEHMTDKELLQRWIKPYAIVPVTMDATRILVDGLRERLAQPEKEWVGLTDEEKMEILTRNITAPSRIDVAEALLKEKNNG